MKFKPKNFEKVIPPFKNGYRNGVVISATFDDKFILKNRYYKNTHHGCSEDCTYKTNVLAKNGNAGLKSVDSGFKLKNKSYGEVLNYYTLPYSVS